MTWGDGDDAAYTGASASTGGITGIMNMIKSDIKQDITDADTAETYLLELECREFDMGPVNDYVSSIVVAQLLFLQSESAKKPIHMYINSPGGSVTAGLAIYDTMQYVLPPISTWCVGQACSMGSLLLSAGTHGMRHSLPNSRIMVHQPSGGASGQATDILIQAEEITNLKKQLNLIYVKHTGQDLETIHSSLERDKFMSPLQAKEFGLIDKILEHPPKPSGEVEKDEDAAEEVEQVDVGQHHA